MRALGCAVVLCLSLAACSSSGYGSGRLASAGKPNEGPVTFRWSAGADPTSGPIAAVLPDGRRFEGRFMQVTSGAIDDRWGVAGVGWVGPGYGYGYGPGWAYDPYYDSYGYVRQYSGRVVAQLRGPENELMRCFFVLEDPFEGPEEGGMGECAISTGERVDFATLRGEDD